MIKFLLLFFTFSITAYSQCTLESFAHIIKFNKILDSSIIKTTTCSDKVLQKFINFVSDVEGEIPAKHLKNIFSSEHKIEINFKPNMINVQSAGEFVKNKAQLNEYAVKDVRSLYGNASYNTDSINNIRISCSQCSSPGEKNIKLITADKQIWLSATFLVKRQALVLNKDLNPFQDELNQNAVSVKSIYDTGNDQLFSDYEHIKYYKVNKNLLKGNTLKQFDLTPKTLVKFNQNVEVIVKGSKVALKSRAISRESGRFGQIINLYNPKTKKVIKAKVIDFNKVMVEI